MFAIFHYLKIRINSANYAKLMRVARGWDRHSAESIGFQILTACLPGGCQAGIPVHLDITVPSNRNDLAVGF